MDLITQIFVEYPTVKTISIYLLLAIVAFGFWGHFYNILYLPLCMAVLVDIGFIGMLYSGLWWFPIVYLPLGLTIIFINYWAYDFTKDLIESGEFFNSNFELLNNNKNEGEIFGKNSSIKNTFGEKRVIRRCTSTNCTRYVRLPINREGLVLCPHCNQKFYTKT